MSRTKKTLAVLIATTAMTSGLATAQTTLNVVGSWSGLELHRMFEAPYWNDALPAASNGTMTTNLTTHNQMGIPGDDVYNLLSEGIYDVGMTVMDYAVSDAPEMEALDLPMISLDVATARKLTEAYMPIADMGMNKRFDAKVLAIVPYPQQIVFCNTPVADIEDLKGLNIRASGRSTLEFLGAAGANPLNIAFNEVPGALSRGVIDCAVTGSMSGYSSAWYEMATHLYTLPAGGWDFVVTAMRNETWNKLSSEEQEILLSSIQADFIEPVWANAEIDTEQGIACLTGKGTCDRGEAANMTLVEPTSGDFARSRVILEDNVLPNWVRRVDDETVTMWNERVGSILDLTASR